MLEHLIAELKAHTTLGPVEAFNVARRWLEERREAGLPERDARQVAAELAERMGLAWRE